ncbi:MAG: translation initiation factor [Candidatus Protochlamydia sp.]|nr:translation initiation factor [Candidatus Protochlamydia sp.]
MPFTIGGEWVPDQAPKKPKLPIKITKEKRGSSLVTLILYLPFSSDELLNLCSALKKQLGCGGSVKGDSIELQGDKIEGIKNYLKKKGILKN